MFKLEYTLIEDFLIRTKLNFTRNIFNNEMKSIMKPLIPLEDKEISKLLGLDFNELYNIWKDNDLPVPGFPTIIKGTLLIMQVKHVKRFSLKARFKAIPLFFSIIICFVIFFISYSGKVKKVLLS